MWRNCGRKIQITSIIWLVVAAIASLVGAIELWSKNSSYFNTVGLGFLVLIGGALLGIISSWLMYGFGVIVEKAEHDREEFAPGAGSRGFNFAALFSGNNQSYNNGYNGGNAPYGQNGAPYNTGRNAPAGQNGAAYNTGRNAPAGQNGAPYNTGRNAPAGQNGSYPPRSAAPSNNTGSYGAYNGWVCPNCKTRNAGNAAACIRCGAKRQG